VLGATDPNLTVDRLSADVEDMLGVPAESLLGRSLLALVAPASVVDLLWALSHAAATSTGVSVRLALRSSTDGEVWVQVLLVPLEPPAACAFAFVGSRPEMTQTTAAGVVALLKELAGCVDAVEVSRRVAALRGAQAGILSRLTARELDVVSRLLAGDRVPAIAKALFLAQSTVRNVLSSVFAKLGVKSQQQLIDLLRESDEPSAKSDGLPLS